MVCGGTCGRGVVVWGRSSCRYGIRCVVRRLVAGCLVGFLVVVWVLEEGVRMLRSLVMLLVAVRGIFGLAWALGVGVTTRGFAHANDFFFLEGFVFVLPVLHGLLGFKDSVVEGIIGEGFVVCEGCDELCGVWGEGTRRRLGWRRGDVVASGGKCRGSKTGVWCNEWASSRSYSGVRRVSRENNGSRRGARSQFSGCERKDRCPGAYSSRQAVN